MPGRSQVSYLAASAMNALDKENMYEQRLCIGCRPMPYGKRHYHNTAEQGHTAFVQWDISTIANAY